MRRHDSLIPFARDHHSALVVAIGLKRAGNGAPPAQLAAIRALVAEWHDTLEQHFAAEERVLPPLLLAEEWSRLTGDHAQLRQAAAAAGRQLACGTPDAGFCRSAGILLEQHIRWEDRELFGRIEARASREQLDELARQTSQRRA